MPNAYLFEGNVYCPTDIVRITHRRFHDSTPIGQPAEDYLNQAARFRGIRRDHPDTFTDSQFPKGLENPSEGQTCIYCHKPIKGDQ